MYTYTIEHAVAKLADLISARPYVVAVRKSPDGRSIEVVVERHVDLRAVATWMPRVVDGFPVVIRHGDWPRPFGSEGYASPTRYAVLDPLRIVNEK
jgi:hypothetical protein